MHEISVITLITRKRPKNRNSLYDFDFSVHTVLSYDLVRVVVKFGSDGAGSGAGRRSDWLPERRPEAAPARSRVQSNGEHVSLKYTWSVFYVLLKSTLNLVFRSPSPLI